MRLRLFFLAAAHFLVDLSCALLLLGRLCPNCDPARAVLLYNFFAFAVQMPLGLLADRFGACRYFAAGGCLLAAVSWLFPPGLAAAAAAGLGNAAFHVGGGLDTLNSYGNRAGPLGLFVSPGALGVFLGGQWAGSASALPVCMLLLSAAISLLLVKACPDNAPLALPDGGPGLWGIAACLFAVVVLRSYSGLAAALPWKANAGLAAVCAVACGKAAGGCLADRFGMVPTAMASLVLSALCYLFSDGVAAGLAAIFLFNMTMPLTLWAMARLFPGAKGFSFGLLTFGLFLGFLPFYYGYGGLGPAQLAAGAALSVPLLVWGLRGAEKGAVRMSFAVSLALTLLLEGCLALLWGFRRRDLLLFVLANVLTNPPALLLHMLFRGWAVTAAVELAAVGTEGLLFARLGEGIKRPWLFSLAANGFSFSLGLFIDKIL